MIPDTSNSTARRHVRRAVLCIRRIAKTPRAIALTAMVAMVASACGGGETAVIPDFVLEMSPIELVMRQGETGQGIASLRRIGGFDGSVSVVPVTLPEHVTMSAAEFNGFETSLFFTVTAAENALISGYPITVRATASDGRVQTAKFFISLLQAPPPSIELVLSGSLVTVVAGRTDAVLPFTIVRRGAVVDPVTVRAVELLPGVTMEPRVLPAGKSVDSARFSAEAGSFSSQNFIYLIASSGDLAEDTVRLTFRVQAISKPTTTFVPAGIGIAPGDSGSAKLVVTRIQGEYQGAVSFALLEPPPGLAATLTVQPDSFSAVIQVRAARDQKPGDYTIPIALYSYFPIPDTLQLLVHVFQPGNIVFVPCTEAGTVRVVAFLDGNAPWREASRFARDLFFPNIVSERGGIAWSTEDNTGSHVQIVYGTREELRVYSTSGCYSPPVAPTSMTGTLVGGRADDVLLLHSGWHSSPLVRTSSSTFRIDHPPEYSFALFAVRRRSGSEVPRMAIRRMILVSSGPVIAPLDFASANGFDAIASTLIIPNAPPSGLIVETSFHQGASDAGFVPYRTDTVAAGISQHVWFGAPLGRLETNDWHQVLVRDRVPASSSWSRSSSRGYFLPPSSSELRLPDVPIAPLFNSSRSPEGFVRVRAVVADPASSAVWEDSNYQLQFTQPNSTRVSVTTTRRYLDGMPLAIDAPDLVTPNWLNRWRLQPGVSTTWQLRTRRWAHGYFDSQFPGVSTESTEVRGVITLP